MFLFILAVIKQICVETDMAVFILMVMTSGASGVIRVLKNTRPHV